MAGSAHPSPCALWFPRKRALQTGKRWVAARKRQGCDWLDSTWHLNDICHSLVDNWMIPIIVTCVLIVYKPTIWTFRVARNVRNCAIEFGHYIFTWVFLVCIKKQSCGIPMTGSWVCIIAHVQMDWFWSHPYGQAQFWAHASHWTLSINWRIQAEKHHASGSRIHFTMHRWTLDDRNPNRENISKNPLLSRLSSSNTSSNFHFWSHFQKSQPDPRLLSLFSCWSVWNRIVNG